MAVLLPEWLTPPVRYSTLKVNNSMFDWPFFLWSAQSHIYWSRQRVYRLQHVPFRRYTVTGMGPFEGSWCSTKSSYFRYSQDPKATSLSFLLSTVTLDDESSLSVDGEDEYASQIYELDRRKLELGQIIGQVTWCDALSSQFSIKQQQQH